MKSQQNAADAKVLQGERGIPSVNENQKKSWQNRLAILVMIGGIVISLLLGAWSFKKSQQKKEKSQSDKQMAETLSSVPARTFLLPKNKEETHGRSLFENAPPEPPALSGQNIQKNHSLDKNASGLMIAQAQANHSTQKTANDSDLTGQGVVNTLLYPSKTPAQSATLLKNRHYLLTKGNFINCVLQKELVSTVPGMVSCRVIRNVYSATGKVLLIEKGSMASGEYQSSLKQGQGRIFVLWTRIETPNGVVINLDSPGTNALGSSGLPGHVDTHFWERFGGAMMLSVMQDAVSASSKAFQHKGETININHTSDASQNMATEALHSSINIPPTLSINHGEPMGIYVARDLDFRRVYDLQPE